MGAIAPRREFTLYQKLLALFLASLLPFFALSSGAARVAGIRLREQRLQQLNAQLYERLDQFESELSRIGQAAQLFILRERARLVSLSENYPDVSSYQLGQLGAELHTELVQFAMCSDFIRDAEVFLPRISRSFGLMVYYEDNVTPAKTAFYDTFLSGSRYSIHWFNKTLHITLTASGSNDDMPAFLMDITLSANQMLGSLPAGEIGSGFMLFGPDWSINDPAETLFAVPTKEPGPAVSVGPADSVTVYADAASGLAAVSPGTARPLPVPAEATPAVTAWPAEGSVIPGVLSQDKESGTLTKDGYLYCWKAASLAGATLVAYVNLDELMRPIAGFDHLALIALLLAALGVFLIRLRLDAMLGRPMRKLLLVIKKVRQGELSLPPETDINGEFRIILDSFRDMLTDIRALIDKTVEQNNALQRVEYKQLQSQIAPHFLYNSFNVLRHLIHAGDTETSEHLLTHLGSYFHYITYTGQDVITLCEEYEHASAYLQIQKIRFQDNIDIRMDPLPSEYRDLRVPRLVLQPIVENIFKHGIRDMAYASEIIIRVEAKPDELHIIVWDNGQGMDSESLAALLGALESDDNLAEYSGLINTNRRLLLHSGGKSRLTVRSEYNRYFEICLCLALAKADGGF